MTLPDFIYRPDWIKPNLEETLTVLCGIIIGLVSVWERMLEYFAKFGQIKLNVINSHATITTLVVSNHPRVFRAVDVSILIENQSSRDLAIGSVKVFPINSRREIGHILSINNVNTLTFDLIPKKETRRIVIDFFAENNPVNPRDKLIIEVSFAHGRILKKEFILAQ